MEGVPGARRFPAVRRDRRRHILCSAVVQKAVAVPKAPEGSRAKFAGGGVRSAHVRELGAHVVQEQVGVGPERLPGQGGGSGRAGPQLLTVAGCAADLAEERGALREGVPGGAGRGWGGGRRRQEADVLGQVAQRRRIDLGVGHGVGVRGDGDTVARLLDRVGRRREAELEAQRGVDEIFQRGRVALAAEAGRASVGKPWQPARNAVAVEVVRIGPLGQHRVGNGLDQAEAEQRGGGHEGGGGGRRGNLFGAHAVRDQEVGGAALDVVAAFRVEKVAAAVREAGRLEDAYPLCAATSHGGLIVTVAAPFLVVERAEPLVGGCEALEEGAAKEEAPALSRAEAGHGFAGGAGWFGWNVAACGQREACQ